METLAAQLQTIATSEGGSIDRAAAHAIARQAEGSVARRAVTAGSGERHGRRDDRRRDGPVAAGRASRRGPARAGRRRRGRGRARCSRSSTDWCRTARTFATSRPRRSRISATCCWCGPLRDRRTCSTSRPTAYEQLRAQSGKFTPGEIARVIALLLAAQNDMRWTTSPRLSLELALIRATIPETDADTRRPGRRASNDWSGSRTSTAGGSAADSAEAARSAAGAGRRSGAASPAHATVGCSAEGKGPRRGDPRSGAAKRGTAIVAPSAPRPTHPVPRRMPQCGRCRDRGCGDAAAVMAVVIEHLRCDQADDPAGACWRAPRWRRSTGTPWSWRSRPRSSINGRKVESRVEELQRRSRTCSASGRDHLCRARGARSPDEPASVELSRTMIAPDEARHSGACRRCSGATADRAGSSRRRTKARSRS